MSNIGSRRKKLILVAISSMIPLLFLEVFCYTAFSDPQRLPEGFTLLALRGIYLNTRDFVQYNKHCARYDARLTYTLRPGKCTFSNAEFSSEILVNSVGLRDDEASLKNPDIIVLGDSHSMGWGVNQEETYSNLLEKHTGLSVLNTAITSYGTAREVESALRLNHQHAKFLIIQYCPNDFAENLNYVNRGYKLNPMQRDIYENTVNDIEPPEHYWPGQHLARTVEVQVFHRAARLFLGSTKIPDPTGPSPRPDSHDYAADLFVQILQHSGITSGRQLTLVLEIDAFRTRGNFLHAVENLAKERRITNLKTLSLNSELEPQHYYKLDDHINKLGHRIVADRISEAICKHVDSPPQAWCSRINDTRRR